VQPIDAPFWTLVADAFAAIVNWDGRVMRTLRALLFAPGRLTVEWSAGRRAPYVTPIRLFLATGVVLLAVVGFSGRAAIQLESGQVTTEVSDEAAASSLWRDFGRRMELGVQRAEREPQWITSRFLTNYVWSVLIATPAVAGVVVWLERRRPRRFVHHLVFTLHLHSASLVLLTGIPILDADTPSDALTPWRSAGIGLLFACWPVYVFLAYRRVYGTGPLHAAAKTALLLFVQGFVFSIGAFLVLIATLFFAT
jgi:hypothetical protein